MTLAIGTSFAATAQNVDVCTYMYIYLVNVDCAESIHRSALTGWVLVLTLLRLGAF